MMHDYIISWALTLLKKESKK